MTLISLYHGSKIIRQNTGGGINDKGFVSYGLSVGESNTQIEEPRIQAHTQEETVIQQPIVSKETKSGCVIC